MEVFEVLNSYENIDQNILFVEEKAHIMVWTFGESEGNPDTCHLAW